MNPLEKYKEIEDGKNWIVEFWNIRGYSVVKSTLGINFTLHREDPKFDCLGLDLQYLEQFAQEAIKQNLAYLIDVEKVVIRLPGEPERYQWKSDTNE